MSGNGEEPVGVDRRLAMLRGDDDDRRIEEVAIREFFGHLTNRGVYEFDLARHAGSGITGGIGIASKGSALNQLLSDTDRLEVHTKNRRNGSIAAAKVRLPVNFVQDRIDLQLVVALDGLKIGRPVASAGDNPGAIEVRA